MASLIASGHSDVAHAVIKALLGDDGCHRVRRLVLDIDANSLVKVYVTRWAEKDALAEAAKACQSLAGRVEVVECDEVGIVGEAHIVHVPKAGA